MNEKKWFLQLVLLAFLVAGLPSLAVIGFNYWIDPLWNFAHSHKYNDVQFAFDERQQKTNYLNSRPFDYDNLLIGTSRVTYMDATKFRGEKVFNYALSALHIDEYLPYIRYAAEKKGGDFNVVYMELYYNSYKESGNPNNSPDSYFDKSESFLYKYKTLFSYSTYKRAKENFGYSKGNLYEGARYYTRENVGKTSFASERMDAKLERYINSINKESSINSFVYSDSYKDKLRDIIEAFPDTKFVVFTDPMPLKKQQAILGIPGYREGYVRWYKEMVDIFGEVHSFQGKTSITENNESFFDVSHYLPDVGDKMIEALQDPEGNQDILTVVNADNIDEYLSTLLEDSL